jgi:hypothetical protein
VTFIKQIRGAPDHTSGRNESVVSQGGKMAECSFPSFWCSLCTPQVIYTLELQQKGYFVYKFNRVANNQREGSDFGAGFSLLLSVIYKKKNKKINNKDFNMPGMTCAVQVI